MSGVRPMVAGFGGLERKSVPGDILLMGESIAAGTFALTGNTDLPGANIVTGLVDVTGAFGTASLVLDTAANILAALKGTARYGELTGSSFRLRVINNLTGVLTISLTGLGIAAGTGLLTLAQSAFRDFLVQILADAPSTIMQSTVLSPAGFTQQINFDLAAGQSAIPQQVASGPGNQIVPGMLATGTGLAAGATVIGIVQGQGGITGAILSGANTAFAAGITVTFTPRVRVDSIGGN